MCVCVALVHLLYITIGISISKRLSQRTNSETILAEPLRESLCVCLGSLLVAVLLVEEGLGSFEEWVDLEDIVGWVGGGR